MPTSLPNHFYETIPGWFDFQNIYTQAVEDAPPTGGHFVEVGSWLGRSSAYMVVEIIRSGKSIKFDCVDPWDDGGPQLLGQAKNRDLYRDFLKNIGEYRDKLTPIRATSIAAAETYVDKSLDLVFIDAVHTYENVREDILKWRPKVKIGGILAGHDFTIHFPGVKKAVEELLEGQFKISRGSWVHRVTT